MEVIKSAQASTGQGGLSTGEVIDRFMSASSLEEIKQATGQAQDRLFAAFSTVDAVDKQNEIIPFEDAVKAQEKLMDSGASITDMHSNYVVGRTLAWRVMPHPETGKQGILQLNKIYRGGKRHDDVWADIQSGKRTGLSVGGDKDDVAYKKVDGKVVGELVGFEQFETSTVFKPANPYATNMAVSAVAKSDTVTLAQVESALAIIKQFGYQVTKAADEPRIVSDVTPATPADSESNAPAEAKQPETPAETGAGDAEPEKPQAKPEEVKEMAEDEPKGDLKESAMKKLAAGEPLTEDEYQSMDKALKACMPKKADPEPDKEPEDMEEEDEETEKADDEEVEKVEGYMEGGVFHPIRGSDGYSNRKVGEKVKRKKTKKSDDDLSSLKAELSELKKALEVKKSETPAPAPQPTQPVSKGITVSDILDGKQSIKFK